MQQDDFCTTECESFHDCNSDYDYVEDGTSYTYFQECFYMGCTSSCNEEFTCVVDSDSLDRMTCDEFETALEPYRPADW